MIEKLRAFMEKQIASIAKLIEKKRVQDKNLHKTMTILTSVPSVGPSTASKLIAEMLELAKISNKKAAALLGVAPIVHQSGTSKGKATIFGGRQQVQHTIYMAGMVAATHNTVLRNFTKGLSTYCVTIFYKE